MIDKPAEPKPTTFRQLIKEAWVIVDELKKVNPNIDNVELSHKLNEHFPGIVSLSKELSGDSAFLAEIGASADLAAVKTSSKSAGEFVEKLGVVNQLHTSEFAKHHRNSVRFGVLMGLELGFILSKLYTQQSKNDDEFDKFMKSLGMEAPPEGSVQ